MRAAVIGIEYYLPDQRLTNDQLSSLYPGWTPAKIESKTGILERHIAAKGECSSDLAVTAARRLFASGLCAPSDVDYVLLCTQSPDYLLPTTACLLQARLGLPTSSGAIDINQGCSGFVYSLGLAKALVETGQAKRVLLLTAETYSKFIHPGDKSVRSLFGDAASATLVGARAEGDANLLGPFVYGTDGRGAPNLIVPTGGLRRDRVIGAPEVRDDSGNIRTVNDLYMNGPEIFAFALRTVPEAVNRLLALAGLASEEIDLYVFHQASGYILEHLRRKLNIPRQKFIVELSHCGNTVSSTIPIALKAAQDQGRLRTGDRVMLVGFGVGYSWAAAIVLWTADVANVSS
jgi:3-oxoacyl-[acyl-carrier-protein] synthase III